MKQLFTLTFVFFFWTTSFSQVDPCSINAGSPIDICNTDVSFELNGNVGANVDLTSLVWSTDTPSLFDIIDPNDLNSSVNV